MNPERCNQPTIHTFVIRLWREWSLDNPRWRGRVVHLPSGTKIAFQDWDQLLAFIRQPDRDENPK